MALVSIAALNSPIRRTDNATLLTNVAQLNSNNLNDTQRRAMMVWFLTFWLKGLGGTDYTTALTTLVRDAQNYLNAFQPSPQTGDDYESALAAVFYNAALNGGSAPTHTAIKDLLQDTSVLSAKNRDDLDQLVLFLLVLISIKS